MVVAFPTVPSLCHPSHHALLGPFSRTEEKARAWGQQEKSCGEGGVRKGNHCLLAALPFQQGLLSQAKIRTLKHRQPPSSLQPLSSYKQPAVLPWVSLRPLSAMKNAAAGQLTSVKKAQALPASLPKAPGAADSSEESSEESDSEEDRVAPQVTSKQTTRLSGDEEEALLSWPL